ncbi:MAG TPA: hypothetical protein VHB51_03915 [Candidatus Saccharimonadales bacterium]|nr:hypothetical protein [Candidatus Saccharimonadales bacterium]
MKNFFRKLTLLAAPLGLLAALVAPALPALAAGASITLDSNTSTVANGGSLVVAIYMNGGGQGVNAVEADISYPASQLQYVGFSSTGTAFEIGASSGGSNGLATVDRGTTSSVSGSGLVGTMTFKALVGSGSANIGVAGSSSLVVNGSAIPYTSSGLTVHFGAGSSSSKAPAAPAPPKDTTAPTISQIAVKDLTPFSATITWTTSEAADSTVEYGLDANYGLSASNASPTISHSVKLSSAFLTPETLLHYSVKSTDSSGNVATSTDQSVQLPGVPVTIVVRGANGQPQAGVTVSLDNASGTTDANGQVVLRSSLGNKKIITNYQGVTIQRSITVNKSDKPQPPYKLDLARQPLNRWMLLSFGLGVAVLTLLAIDAFLFGSHFFRRATGLHRLGNQLQPAAATSVPAPTPSPVNKEEPQAAESAAPATNFVDSLAVDTPEKPSAPISIKVTEHKEIKSHKSKKSVSG